MRTSMVFSSSAGLGVGVQRPVLVAHAHGAIQEGKERDFRAAQSDAGAAGSDAWTASPALNVRALERVRSSRRARTSSSASGLSRHGRCASSLSRGATANRAFHCAMKLGAKACAASIVDIPSAASLGPTDPAGSGWRAPPGPWPAASGRGSDRCANARRRGRTRSCRRRRPPPWR